MLSACSYSEEQLTEFDKRIETFAVEKSFQLVKSESGLYTQIMEAGTGREILLTDSIGVSYVGKLLSGKKFDEQKKTIYLPMHGVILGWKEALIGQKQGVKLRVVIPPQLGYGASGMDKVPPNAPLYFELRIDDVK
jgi:FKBP-type peptidyl-prolyl cis-trans isomerase FkpA